MVYTLGFGLLLTSFLQNFSALPWRAAHSEWFAFVAVVVWCWPVLRSRSVVCTSTIMTLLCLASLVVVQGVSQRIAFRGDAAVLLLYIQLCLGALVVGQTYAQDPHWAQALAITLLLAALASACVALAQALWVWMDSGWIVVPIGYRRPGGNIGQANHLATLMVMGGASLIYLHQRLKVAHGFAFLLGALLLLGMGVSESRTGLLSGLGLCAWWSWHGWVLQRRAKGPVVVGVAVMLLMVMWFWPLVIVAVHEVGVGGAGTDAALNAAAGVRPVVWQQLWDAVLQKPWFGWGLRGVTFALAATLDAQPLSAPFGYAHNIVLDMAIGMGIPLTLLALVAVLVWAWRRVRSVFTPEGWFAVGLLIPFAVHSLLEYPFAYAYFLVPTMLAVGLLEPAQPQPLGRRLSRPIVSALVLSFSGLLVWTSVEYLQAEEDFSVARFEALRVGKTAADYARPPLVLLTQLGVLMQVTRVVPHPGMTAQDLQTLQTAAARFPWVPVQNAYAMSLALNGEVAAAQRELRILRAMHGNGAWGAVERQWRQRAQSDYPQLQGIANMELKPSTGTVP